PRCERGGTATRAGRALRVPDWNGDVARDMQRTGSGLLEVRPNLRTHRGVASAGVGHLIGRTGCPAGITDSSSRSSNVECRLPSTRSGARSSRAARDEPQRPSGARTPEPLTYQLRT